MLPVLIALTASFVVLVLLGWWLLRLHRELVLLAWAVERAGHDDDPVALHQAEAQLRQRMAGFPAGALGRWMAISAPRSPDTPTQAR